VISAAATMLAGLTLLGFFAGGSIRTVPLMPLAEADIWLVTVSSAGHESDRYATPSSTCSHISQHKGIAKSMYTGLPQRTEMSISTAVFQTASAGWPFRSSELCEGVQQQEQEKQAVCVECGSLVCTSDTFEICEENTIGTSGAPTVEWVNPAARNMTSALEGQYASISTKTVQTMAPCVGTSGSVNGDMLVEPRVSERTTIGISDVRISVHTPGVIDVCETSSGGCSPTQVLPEIVYLNSGVNAPRSPSQNVAWDEKLIVTCHANFVPRPSSVRCVDFSQSERSSPNIISDELPGSYTSSDEGLVTRSPWLTTLNTKSTGSASSHTQPSSRDFASSHAISSTSSCDPHIDGEIIFSTVGSAKLSSLNPNTAASHRSPLSSQPVQSSNYSQSVGPPRTSPSLPSSGATRGCAVWWVKTIWYSGIFCIVQLMVNVAI
jgi:hypothetical protein